MGLAIEKALQALPHKHRTALLLREFEGLSYEEMAQVMECNIGTVMSRLHHARKKMQRSLIEMGIVEEKRPCISAHGFARSSDISTASRNAPKRPFAHLTECAICRAHTARLASMRDGFHALLVNDAELSDGQFPAFVRSIQDRLDAPSPRPSPLWWTWASV